MKLITIDNWRNKEFDQGSAPAELTVRRWLRDEKLPGKKIGGTWYIDLHKWQADGNDLVESVLAG